MFSIGPIPSLLCASPVAVGFGLCHAAAGGGGGDESCDRELLLLPTATARWIYLLLCYYGLCPSYGGADGHGHGMDFCLYRSWFWMRRHRIGPVDGWIGVCVWLWLCGRGGDEQTTPKAPKIWREGG